MSSDMRFRAIFGRILRQRCSTRSLIAVNKRVHCPEGSLDVIAAIPCAVSLLSHFSSARILSTSELSLLSPSWDSSTERQIMSFVQNLQWKAKYDPVNQFVEMEHPGLSYESVDSNGNPKLWSLLNLLVSGRFYAYHSKITPDGHSFLEYDRMTADRFTFMVASEVHIDRAMYEGSVVKNPLWYKLELGHVGNTSLNTIATVMDHSLQYTLLSNTNQVVCVDKGSRRPITLPDWWREKYAGAATRREPLRFAMLSPPTHPSPPEYHVKVAWSDTDMYRHTNFATYVRYSIDALHNAVGKPGITTLNEDVISCGVKYVGMTYTGESLMGDALAVKVWEGTDEGTPIYICNIHKENDHNQKSIFQCRVKYFEMA